MYLAIWKNGPLTFNFDERKYTRKSDKAVVLKWLNTRKSDNAVGLKWLYDSQNITNEFLNEV